MGSLSPLLIYRVTNHSDFPEAVQFLTLKVYFPGKPLVPVKPGWSVIISHLRSLVSNMKIYNFKLELYVSQSYMAKAQNVLCKSLYLPACISDLSSLFCLPKEEAKSYSQGRVDVGEKWVWDLRRDQLWNKLWWEHLEVNDNNKRFADWQQRPIWCQTAWLGNGPALQNSVTRPICRKTKRYIIIFPIRCLEGLQKKVLPSLKLVPRGRLHLNQGQEENLLGSCGFIY